MKTPRHKVDGHGYSLRGGVQWRIKQIGQNASNAAGLGHGCQLKVQRRSRKIMFLQYGFLIDFIPGALSHELDSLRAELTHELPLAIKPSSRLMAFSLSQIAGSPPNTTVVVSVGPTRRLMMTVLRDLKHVWPLAECRRTGQR